MSEVIASLFDDRLQKTVSPVALLSRQIVEVMPIALFMAFLSTLIK